MSGMYDMTLLRLSKRSSHVKFTDEMEQNHELSRPSRSLHDHRETYGSHETPEFQRQNRDFADPVRPPENPSNGSTTVLLRNSRVARISPNARAALALMNLWAG